MEAQGLPVFPERLLHHQEPDLSFVGMERMRIGINGRGSSGKAYWRGRAFSQILKVKDYRTEEKRKGTEDRG